MTITLSKRLSTLVNMIPENTILYDIGCDHGYTSITAVEKKICLRAFACDVRTGPLQAAASHVEEAGLQSRIQTILSDGLKEIPQVEEKACVLISGMGGELMSSILGEALAAGRLRPDTILILQPQSELGEFRRFLYKNGMIILDEDMVYEEGKYYPMMKVCFDKISDNEKLELTVVDYEYGPILLSKKHPELKKFIIWKQKLQAEVLDRLKGQKLTERIDKKIVEVEIELSMMEAVLKDFF